MERRGRKSGSILVGRCLGVGRLCRCLFAKARGGVVRVVIVVGYLWKVCMFRSPNSGTVDGLAISA